MELHELRAEIEKLRLDTNARLDALLGAVDRLLAGTDTPVTPAQHTRPVQEEAPQPPASAPLAYRVGDEVYVPRLGGTHRVVEVAPGGRTFKVQAGALRVELRREEVWDLDDEQPPRLERRASTPGQARPEVKATIEEIDLHGFRESEALTTLELFLHDAFRRRVARVRIIHGKGNGTLREAVRRELARHPHVHRVEHGPYYRGDDGVTLADLDV